MICGVCGGGDLVHGRQLIHRVYKGDEIMVELVGDRCPVCGEVVLDKENGNKFFAAMAEQKKRVNAPLADAKLIQEVRAQLKLTQRQAGELFGGGPNAFSRYENGQTKPPLSLVQLFKILGAHPDLMKMLDQRPALAA